ncbi:retention module-containing protein [Marinobacterium rhizophilum]|uniref:Retention module-containing protein n=1 Tax=Marinobacterium rhizophilum TaxID=420402 RepID=A0ABY5HQW5_9GAMM|nr:retention module-containing protein [Marinobacterium rhizophilum]UTW13609.1 retention module-containing protein [Marinobacterium rhizophilum]
MAIGDVAGSVSFVFGTVIAVGTNGAERVLSLGDTLYEGEQIRVAEGARIEIAATNGELLALGSGQEAMVDAGFLTASSGDAQVLGQDVAATVTSITGTVVAVAADGSERILAVGDVLFEGELIRVASGGSVQLTGASGETVSLASGQQALITPEFYADAAQFDASQSVASGSSADQALQQTGEIDAIQAAILAGEDPTAVAEATAAGQAAGDAGGPGDSGSSFVLLSRTGQEVTPEAGYPTIGLSRGFTVPENEDVLLTEAEPVVSVVIKEPEPPQGGEPPPEPTPDFPIVVSGSGALVLEGTNGGEPRVITFLLTLDKAYSQDVTVTYELRPGTASYPDDWFDGQLINVVVIPAGETVFEVPISIVMDHLDEGNETFEIVLLSADGASLDPSASSANVTIIDDDTTPVAVDDSNSISDPDAVSAQGNVLDNDTDEDGDDIAGNLEVVIPQGETEIALQHQYGDLTIQSDGSYEFVLNDEGKAAFLALDDSDPDLEISFPDAYQVTDGYNPGNTADVVITLVGTNDGPEVVVDTGNPEGANDVVYESGLAVGSDSAADTEFAFGSFTLSDPDGLDDLVSISINGEAPVLIGDLVNATFAGASGTLTITAYDALTGVASYQYELTSPTTDVDAVVETDVFSLTVSDGTLISAPAAITIEIVDDVPDADPDSGDVIEGATLVVAAAAGVLVNDTEGADGASLQGVRAANGDTTTPVSGDIGSEIGGEYGTLTLNADGSYSYKSTANAIGSDAQDVFVYTLVDGDGDTSTTTLTINLTNVGLVVEDDNAVQVNEAALDEIKDGDDLVAGTVTGSDPGSTAETSTAGDLSDNVAGGTGPYTFALDGGAAGTYGTIQVNSDGTYIYTLTAPVTSDPATDDGPNVELGADSFNFTVTDANGNTGQGTIYINIVDDVPSVTIGITGEGGEAAVVLQTDDALTDGDPTDDDVAVSSAAFGGIFAATPIYGADGAGSTVVSYSLALAAGVSNGDDSGLNSGGVDITLALVGGEIVGSAGGTPVFTISVDGDGVVTLTQSEAIDHIEGGAFDDVIALANGLVELTATATTTDSDGDTATDSASVDLGGNISFVDDEPSVTITATGEAAVVLQTDDALTDGDPTDDDVAVSSAAFGGIFAATPIYGADGAGSTVVSYSLALAAGVSNGDDSGLNSGGVDITLALVGGEIVGSAGGTPVFTISVDGDGVVTLTQSEAIDHIEGGAFDDVIALANGLVELTATATTTDSDGDTATDSASVDLGGNISFVDDEPSVTITATGEAAVVLQTDDALTDGDPTDDDVAVSSAAFGGIFAATPIYGADGAGSTVVSYSLALAAGVSNGDDSGLNSGGVDITLALVGGEIVGSAGGTPVFTISVDGDGVVTLTQSEAIDHIEGGAFDDVIALANGLVELTATATTTDSDGDTATDSASVDLGGNISFVDDEPSVTITATGEAAVVLQTDDALTDGDPTDDDVAVSSAAFGGIFAATPIYGADGAGSTVVSYSLALAAGVSNGDDSGLNSGGVDITLALVGGEIVGSAGGTPVFTISVDGDGVVTLTQSEAIDHIEGGAFDDVIALANGLVELTATATTTDSDGDTATDSASVDLGGNISFVDDEPSVTITATGEAAVVLQTDDALTDGDPTDDDVAVSSAAFGGIFAATPIYGADGAGSTVVSYSLALAAGVSNGDDSGLNSGGVDITLALVGGEIVGSAGGTPVFTISVDGDGFVTLTQSEAIDHIEGGAFDDVIALANGLVELTATATTTDSDGDTATDSASVDLGGNISFVDDEPSVTLTLGSDTNVVLKTQDSRTDGDPTETDTATSAVVFGVPVTLSTSTGADGLSSAGYSFALSLVSGDGTSSGLSSGGADIFLYQLADGTVVGSTSLSAPVSIDASVVFSIGVAADGKVTLSQYGVLDHTLAESMPAYDDDVQVLANGLVNLSVSYTIVDGDGDSATDTQVIDLGGNIQFADDGPSAFAPMSTTIVNSASAGGVAALDVFGNTGADGLGSTVFVGTDGTQLFAADGVTAVTSGGEDLFMTGFGTDTLEVRDGADTLVMTITLNPDADTQSSDLYTVELHQKIDDGSGVLFDDFSDTAAGLNQWVGVDGDGGDIMDDTNDSQDLLVTAPGSTVNTDSDDIGVGGGQALNPDDILRLDFVTDLRRDGADDEKDPTGFIYDDHYAVNNFSVTLIQVQGNANQVAALGFKILDFDDTGNKKDLAGNSTPLALMLASVVVTAADGVTVLTLGVDYFTSMSGDILYVSGVKAGQSISFMGASDFEAVEIENVSGQTNPDGGTFSGNAFALGAFGFDTALAGSDVSMAFDIAMADGDGDTVASTIDLTVKPVNGAVTGTSGDDALGGADTDDELIGGAGNDILTGNGGSDIFVWNDGDEGTQAAPAVDTVTDFSIAEGDVLNLADLLQGEHDGSGVDADNLDQFLSFAWDGANTTVSIAHDALNSADVTQKIVLQGVDLTAGGTLNDQQIIDALVAGNNLLTDQ